MMNRKNIYISIPITGHDERKQREKADHIKSLISKRGDRAINPFDIYSGKNPTIGAFMGADITAFIEHVDAILMCKGREPSKGSRVERFTAETYGKKIIYESDDELKNDNYSKKKFSVYPGIDILGKIRLFKLNLR